MNATVKSIHFTAKLPSGLYLDRKTKNLFLAHIDNEEEVGFPEFAQRFKATIEPSVIASVACDYLDIPTAQKFVLQFGGLAYADKDYLYHEANRVCLSQPEMGEEMLSWLTDKL
jgi:hypothetical protein